MNEMNTSESDVLKNNLNLWLKQVEYLTFSIVRKYYLGVLFAIMIAPNTSAQSSAVAGFTMAAAMIR